MKKKMTIVWGVFIVVILLGMIVVKIAGGRPLKKAEPKEVTAFTDSLLNEQHFKGVVLLAQEGEVYYEQAYGYANQEEEQRNAVTLSYPIASVQKSLTAMLVEQLVSEGRLSYDQTIEAFYPQVEQANDLTIRDLLNHRSGIEMDEIEPDSLLDNQAEQLNFVLTEMSVTEDQSFTYTNANYSLLAGILSMVSGQSYQELFEERIIEPLNLKQTYFWNQIPTELGFPLAYTFDEVTGQDYQVSWASYPDSRRLFSSLLGAGNVFMSVGDLWKVQKAQNNGKILTEKMYNEMTETVTNGYSSGLWLSDHLKISSGSLGGYTTSVYGDEKNENLVILISNQAGSIDTGSMAEQIYEALTE
ncbi:hypothetical protein BAU15_09900 [Enterococcus sp. JM4C]|uniref:serine hydrolase domain-containing protein n=1 Tax=Candidatus Enterococcus huntleyi TaxID=1857217 RepID=UPI00137A162E|nr:serine hydrolase domain-containing protein [Enterococcus sp. JM4C]KAF1298149.1 hypothetical protein BAU15_09900 [Enterococcus sp. JM4C]